MSTGLVITAVEDPSYWRNRKGDSFFGNGSKNWRGPFLLHFLCFFPLLVLSIVPLIDWWSLPLPRPLFLACSARFFAKSAFFFFFFFQFAAPGRKKNSLCKRSHCLRANFNESCRFRLQKKIHPLAGKLPYVGERSAIMQKKCNQAQFFRSSHVDCRFSASRRQIYLAILWRIFFCNQKVQLEILAFYIPCHKSEKENGIISSHFCANSEYKKDSSEARPFPSMAFEPSRGEASRKGINFLASSKRNSPPFLFFSSHVVEQVGGNFWRKQ